MVDSKPPTSQMEYRYLGNTGLKVSVLSFGNMSQIIGIAEEEKQSFMTESVKRCLAHGINYIDTAELYGFGEAERLLGNSLKDLQVKREEVVISTKIFHGAGDKGSPVAQIAYYQSMGLNQVGTSRKHVIEGTKNSLKRLQLEYVDIVFACRPDIHTPLEETCRAFSWVVDNGLALYWATSEWEPDMIAEAIQICQKLGLYGPVAEQC